MQQVKTMNASGNTSRSERFGRWAGRMCYGYMRRERTGVDWVVARGTPRGVAVALLWIVKLVVLGIVLYVSVWLALLLAFAVVVSWAARNDDGSYDKEHQSEWRYGPAGFGLYSFDGQRIDPHDLEDEEN